jgi:glycosyltransferase involved in cell wall biosynthesis
LTPGPTMKILFVASDFPWPKVQGGHLRLATAVEALAGLGETDLFALHDFRREDLTPPSTAPVARLKTVPQRGAPHQVRWRAAWLVHRGIPLEVARERMDPTPRLELGAWARDSYDLVWFDRAAMFERTGRPRLGPTIVDFHDLEDVKARLRMQIMRNQSSSRAAAASIRRSLAIAQTTLNAKDWRRFQHSVAGEVDRVVLSSPLDVQRSGLVNAVVVPNTYERPERALGQLEVEKPPVLLFQGTFDYAPNVDAADWLVEEVLPRLRQRIPDIRLRLVGKPVPGVTRHNQPPTITVVGEVPAMEPELSGAHVAVVPIRYGSGTRLKILESFAHRVPVVSTTIGAEGLDAEHGVHLLLADDPDAFAAACARLLTEPELREQLVGSAEKLYLERYERSLARDRIVAIAREIAGA